ncbi:hypothetical protein PAECIP111893_05220 [Paenibacillus plantiphilus]|uniref:Uncharacterized protein n=1 Tax=Paenibacillus plantiphilus TaxID=2905650 RepID=A0ABM9CUT6_9BACL|nr:hypothetical protein [Paenibacillus plantiphilus]CAH1225122.1 hypothetical protein PAECIP111893_05220 [Paenibacillus plantiphilus]
MPYIPFILLSAPEYIAVLFLTFALFRIKPQGFYPHIVFVSFILGNVSYATRADEAMAVWSSSLQMLVAVVCMWLLFRIPLFYAMIITTVTNVTYGFFQLLFFTGYLNYAIISFEEVSSGSLVGYIVPLSSILFTFLVILIIRRFNLSIDWIPNNPRARVPMNRGNIGFLVITVVILMGYSTIFLWWSNGPVYIFQGITIVLIILLLCLIYMSRRKDQADD